MASRDSNGKDNFLILVHREEGREHSCSELSFLDTGTTGTELGDYVWEIA